MSEDNKTTLLKSDNTSANTRDNVWNYILLPHNVVLHTPSYLKTTILNKLHNAPVIIICILMLIIFLLGLYLYLQVSACRFYRLQEIKKQLQSQKSK
jgi:hypothetical protein